MLMSSGIYVQSRSCVFNRCCFSGLSCLWPRLASKHKVTADRLVINIVCKTGKDYQLGLLNGRGGQAGGLLLFVT
jgi:hypothetical protein